MHGKHSSDEIIHSDTHTKIRGITGLFARLSTVPHLLVLLFRFSFRASLIFTTFHLPLPLPAASSLFPSAMAKPTDESSTCGNEEHGSFSHAAPGFSVIEEHPPLYPTVDIQLSAYACQKALSVLIAASQALTEDVDVFVTNDLAAQERPAASLFVRSSHYIARSLIESVLDQICGILAVSGLHCTPHFQDLLMEAKDSNSDLNLALEDMMASILRACWTLEEADLDKPQLVPTAPPYQLLHEALLQRVNINELLAEQDARTLLGTSISYPTS